MPKHPYIQPLIIAFEKAGNQQKAEAAKAYLRNQFEFYGILSPLRRTISKNYMKQVLPDYNHLQQIVKQLYDLPQRELHYFAMELTAVFHKQWDEKIIGLIEYMIVSKSWWDTVDYIACDLAGLYFKKFPGSVKNITSRWNSSGNMWLVRSSLLFQKKYKKDLDTILLTSYILPHTSSKEFFIQKVIGWVLREYAKTNELWVKDFVKKNSLAPLSKREALKHL
jgi:3-methyladenine DNA glycosylase AlkD